MGLQASPALGAGARLVEALQAHSSFLPPPVAPPPPTRASAWVGVELGSVPAGPAGTGRTTLLLLGALELLAGAEGHPSVLPRSFSSAGRLLRLSHPRAITLAPFSSQLEPAQPWLNVGWSTAVSRPDRGHGPQPPSAPGPAAPVPSQRDPVTLAVRSHTPFPARLNMWPDSPRPRHLAHRPWFLHPCLSPQPGSPTHQELPSSPSALSLAWTLSPRVPTATLSAPRAPLLPAPRGSSRTLAFWPLGQFLPQLPPVSPGMLAPRRREPVFVCPCALCTVAAQSGLLDGHKSPSHMWRDSKLLLVPRVAPTLVSATRTSVRHGPACSSCWAPTAPSPGGSWPCGAQANPQQVCCAAGLPIPVAGVNRNPTVHLREA